MSWKCMVELKVDSTVRREFLLFREKGLATLLSINLDTMEAADSEIINPALSDAFQVILLSPGPNPTFLLAAEEGPNQLLQL